MANISCDDDVKAGSILEWIDSQCKQMDTSKLSCGSNVLSIRTTCTTSNDVASEDTGIGCVSVRDPKGAKRKGAPKKLRKKSPLESSSNKSTAGCVPNKGKKAISRQSNLGDGATVFPTTQQSQYFSTMQVPLSYSELVMGANQNIGYSQNLQSVNMIPLDGQVCHAMPYYVPYLLDNNLPDNNDANP